MIDLLNLQPPWPLALLLAFVVLALAGAAVLGLLVEPGRRPRPTEALVAAVLGLAGLGFLLLVARFLALPSFLVTLVLVAAATLAMVRRGRDLIPSFAGVEANWKANWLGLAIAGLFILPTLIGGALMGLGDYPAIFLNADTPYRLTHVYQFVADRGLPPLSLSNLDVRFGYHYGGPAAVAALHLASGLPVHAAFFLSIAVVTCGLAAAAALLAERIRGPLPFALAFGVILVASPLLVWHIGSAPGKWIEDPQLFLNHFPDLTVYLGLFLFLLVLHACLGLTGRRQVLRAFLVLVVLAATKSSYFAAAGLLVFAAALVETYRTRDLRWMLLPAAAFAVGVTITRLTGSSVTVTPHLEPFFLFAEFGKRAFKHGLDMLLFLLPAVLYAWLAHRAKGSSGENEAKSLRQKRLCVLGLAVLGLFGFLNVFGSYVSGPDGAPLANVVILEPLRMLCKLLAVASILALATVWDPARKGANRAVILYLSLIIALPLAHRTTHALLPPLQPELGHEYVDNEAIGEALAQIPVTDSIVVTNDLRYPADGFRRDHRQMQIPALFGHQAYGANPVYEVYPEGPARAALQDSLASDAWNPDWQRIAREHGWTHLLLHKAAPHPSEIPLAKIFENEAYAVYVFD